MSLFHKIQTYISITDTDISARNVSYSDGKVVSEHTIPMPPGSIIRGVVIDENKFSEAFVSLYGAMERTFHDVVFVIPEAQCFEITCTLPVDIKKEDIQTFVVAHAKTIIPIQHEYMYIGYTQPIVVPNTNTSSLDYIAVEGDVFDAYKRVFEKNKLELKGVQGIGGTPNSALFIPIAQFNKVGGNSSISRSKTPSSAQTLMIPEKSVQKKHIAAYVFIITAFIVLAYIIYTYIIVPFI